MGDTMEWEIPSCWTDSLLAFYMWDKSANYTFNNFPSFDGSYKDPADVVSNTGPTQGD